MELLQQSLEQVVKGLITGGWATPPHTSKVISMASGGQKGLAHSEPSRTLLGRFARWGVGEGARPGSGRGMVWGAGAPGGQAGGPRVGRCVCACALGAGGQCSYEPAAP